MKIAKISLIALGLIARTATAAFAADADYHYPSDGLHPRPQAAVQARQPGSARKFYFLYRRAQKTIDATKTEQNSGTIGRLGLGANPQFPEGPGNPR